MALSTTTLRIGNVFKYKGTIFRVDELTENSVHGKNINDPES
jgi:hypothetical protein